MKKVPTLVLISLVVLSWSFVLFDMMYVHGSLNEDIVTPPPQGNKTSTQMAMENFDTVRLREQAKVNQESDAVEPGDAVPTPSAEETEEMVNQLIYGTSFDPTASSSQSSLSDQDIILLSQRYNDDRFSDEIVGEVLNNGSHTFDKYDVNIDTAFYDATGALVGSKQGFIDAESLNAGDRSAFNVLISDEVIRSNAVTYDLIINDDRVLEGAPINGETDEDQDQEQDEAEDNSN